MSQKLKNINLYLPHERERTSGSREKQTFHIFWALLKLPFKIGDLFTTTIITKVKKTFRKNGMNVGMASTSIGRKELSFIYVDHTINSARGQNDEDVRWWPRAEFMV